MAILRMRLFVVQIFVVLLTSTAAHAEDPEYHLKAAMVGNFALFIEWPATAFPAAESPFVACVVGKDPFGPWLKHELGDRIGNHPVAVRTVASTDAASQCNLVFISKSESSRLKEALTPLQNTSVLTISDVENFDEFCRHGGMISLIMKGKKVRFTLNSDAVARAGLKVGSKLKRLAQSTDCGKGP